MTHTPLARLIISALAVVLVIAASAQNLTVQIGSPLGPATPLVNHSDTWSFHKGTNALQANWQTIADGALNADWGSGAGGFGYGDNGITNSPGAAYESTMLPDMLNRYTTLFIRQTFNVASAVDTNRHLLLTMDYDDGFVAYLDGVEIRRANTTNAVGSTITFTQTTGANSHEASCCNAPINLPTTFDLGAVSNRLTVGTHVLAVVGLNQLAGSTDFHLIPDLAITAAGSVTTVDGNFFSVVSGNSVVLSGTNAVAGSSRVGVNGDDAAFTVSSGAWSKTNLLSPGLNRFFIAALDANGSLFGSTNVSIVSEVSSTDVSGSLAGSNYWSSTMGNIHVTSTVTVPSGASLTIAPGTVVLFNPGAGITVNGALTATGTLAAPLFFGPANGTTEWGTIRAAASGANVQIRFAQLIAGKVSVVTGAAILIEDSTMSRTYNGSMMAGSGGSFTIRRSHLHHFHDSNVNGGNVLAEDMLVEDCDSTDGDPFEMSNATGATIRRFTLRRSTGSNADAFDCNSVNNVTFEDLLIHDISDKGISIGTAGGPGSVGVIVRNCLIYDTRTGIALKDDSRAVITNVTIADSLYGLQCYPKYTTNTINAGGRCTNFFNNILWNNTTQFTVTNGAFVPSFSDLGGTNFGGTNNISSNPLFANESAGDYHLSAGSPCISTGQGGVNMGVIFPVGGLPGVPFDFEAISTGSNSIRLAWRDDADNESAFVIERSTDGANWTNIGAVGENITNYTDATTIGATKYYYRVHAANTSGDSDVSNIASGQRQAPVILAGGTISSSTVWGAGVTVIVTGSVTVAAGATLTIEPCAAILFSQGASLTANGLLLAEGAPGCRILFGLNPGATSWGGINLAGGGSTHRIAYADIDGVAGSNIDINGTAAYLQSLWWTNTTSQLVNCVGSSISMLDSYIPGGFGNEPVHFSSMPATGYALIKGNLFGAPAGYNDSIDFTGGNRPGPIVQFIDNIFLAAVDDCMDLDATDAHIEGNIFLNVHQDATRASSANAVSTGEGSGTSELVVVRNIFYNCDHALLLKDMGSAVFENNTVVTIQTNQFSSTRAAYAQFGEPHRGVPGGRGIVMNGNILWDLHSTTPFIVFTNGTMFMTANDNTIQGTNMMFGGNSTNDPMLVNWQSGITYQNIRSNLALLPGSPALGTGPNGLDRGALVPGGASISGEPPNPTTNTSAMLKVAGPGVYAYRWKLDNGPWSAEVPLTNNFLITATLFSNAAPIILTALSNGTHTVYVVGKNSAGFWQDTNAATVSRAWEVLAGGGDLDADGDGMPDDWEDAHNLNKLVNDAALDPDGDGMSNLQEYLAGTDPQSFSSRLWLHSLAKTGNDFSFSFLAASNKSYTVQYRPSLSTGVWQRLQDFSAVSSNRALTVTNAPGATRFYQVVTPLAL